jgi:CheY-like chemotaxis protein
LIKVAGASSHDIRASMSAGLSLFRILVVDDSPQMRAIIGTVLTAVGVGQVCYAGDGRRALEVLSQAEVDIIYVDLEMPVMNGLAFIAAVRALPPPVRYVPIIMVTGHSFGPSVFQARDAGVTEFLTKPVTARSILSRLDEVVRRPRPFVVAPTYVGPDRRRKNPPDYAGPMRRAKDTLVELQI